MNGGHDEAYCAAHPGPSCDGTWSVQCPSSSAPASVGLECAGTGNQCWLVQGKSLCGVEHPCGAGACTSTGAFYACRNDAVMATAYKCPANTTCRLSSVNREPLCAGTAACNAGDHCVGQVWVKCMTFAGTPFERGTDCAKFGAVCSPTGCVANAEYPCGGGQGSGTCTGDVFQGCIAGHRVSFDCKAKGFARCGTTASGAASCLY
jgi:hypothetical protein